MLVSDIHVRSGQGHCELRARVTSAAAWVNGGEPFWLWYRFPESFRRCLTPGNGDPFLAALLAPAMVTGEPLEIGAPVSAQLLRSAAQIQTIYQCWDRTLSKVAVRAPVRARRFLTLRRPRRVGLFFSLGMDSFYSLLKNVRDHPGDADTITDLLLIHGFDIFVGKWNTGVFPGVVAQAARVAQELKKNLVPVAMNLREFTDQLIDWEVPYHGAALASVALALQPVFRRVYIAGTYTYDWLHPCGTHPLLDPLWSPGGLSFVHDGLEASRPEKARFIGQFPLAMDTLRVCFENPEDRYNCGRCEKCLKSMICLHIAGTLEKCRTLPQAIDLDLCRALVMSDQSMREHYARLILALGASESDADLRAALEEALVRNEASLWGRQSHDGASTTGTAAPALSSTHDLAGTR